MTKMEDIRRGQFGRCRTNDTAPADDNARRATLPSNARRFLLPSRAATVVGNQRNGDYTARWIASCLLTIHQAKTAQ